MLTNSWYSWVGEGHIPIDPFFRTWKAKEYGVNTRFIELAGEINHYMPHWVVQKVADAQNEHAKAVKGSCVLVLSIAYKNIDDTRESPSSRSWTFYASAAPWSNIATPIFPAMREYLV
ncbi:hypothetical protein [Chitinolyticbacter meiyuanensis]|uniref:hypothetical protein n=1 Tax=Chitinolyticbacter meiyuanensis TaxID=682798 RepID=UPI0011E5FA3C